jgi:hypothetical protein
MKKYHGVVSRQRRLFGSEGTKSGFAWLCRPETLKLLISVVRLIVQATRGGS